MNTSQNIIFFDGYCGLCDRFVSEIFFLDKKHRFQFAPLQGPTASRLLQSAPQVDSVIYLKSGIVFIKSQAVLEILNDLGGLYSLAGIFRMVPKIIADSIYDIIARNRYGWFGQTEFCRLPNESEKAYFLD